MSGICVNLGIWLSTDYQNIKIDNIDLHDKVEVLKTEACKKLNNNGIDFELIYAGLILEDNQPLSSYGIKSGVTVHVIKKPPKREPPPVKVYNEMDVQELVAAFRTFTSSSGYRAALQRLARPEVLETIIAATPGLADDAVAIAVMQDPELMAYMSDPDTVRRVAEEHPTLIEAANYIAAHIHEEQVNMNSSHASTSTGYSYSLEALSDDEDMDTTPSNREAHPLTRNTSYNAITAAQLAAAIANATNTVFNTNSAGMPPPPQPTTPTSANIITNEMFSNAIQQAFASYSSGNSSENVGNSGGGSSVPSTPNEMEDIQTMESIRARLQPQLMQMREMGLTNDDINIRALQATSGDVEAAIELVFNGVIE